MPLALGFFVLIAIAFHEMLWPTLISY